YPFIGNLVAAVLSVVPFFAVFIYYRNFDVVIFVHATFLFLLISMRELTKDLENIRGDLAQNYRTIPVVYGEKVSKTMLTALSVLTLVPTALLLTKFEIGHMHLYYYGSVLGLAVFGFTLWQSTGKLHYVALHNILKCIIVAGVFSIVLINVELVLGRLW
ncbi:MAG: UbiA family prenyltransferase, partial [Marinirhabdus sp.]